MTADKPFLDVDDIMNLMKCGKSKAYDYIKVIKTVSDVGKTEGRVMMQDFCKWAYGDYYGSQEIKKLNQQRSPQKVVVTIYDGDEEIKNAHQQAGTY